MGSSRSDVVIVSAVRTPIGKFGGGLKDIRAFQLAGMAMEAALSRAGVDKGAVDFHRLPLQKENLRNRYPRRGANAF